MENIEKIDELEKLKDPKYSKAYSEQKLFEKILKFAKYVGLNIIYIVLLLFFSYQKPDTPKWAKNVIRGALGYFILPFDVIPDIIPGFGYLDDTIVLMAAIGAIAFFIDEDTKQKAKAKLHDWFGDYNISDLDDIDQKIRSKKESKRD